jgi:UPF0042 nucleotide-binding protein
MSGAGKSLVLKQFEDIGYFCVDNLPPSLMSKIIDICIQSGGRMDNLALGMDIRGGALLDELIPDLKEIGAMGVDYKILFLEASDKALVQRYKETRRTHPLAPEGRLRDGIGLERASLESIKNIATWIIDTSSFKPIQLREEIVRIAENAGGFPGIIINVVTFGYKYGIPVEADLVFDVRFTPNPFYESGLKELTGLNAKVADYVFGFSETGAFMERMADMLTFLIPYYRREGKSRLEIGVGCTGGQHRSVAIGMELKRRLEANGNRVVIEHRDIDRAGAPRQA